MDKLLNVYLRLADGGGSVVQLWLPAQPYELRDALQRAHLSENTVLTMSVSAYGNGLDFLRGAFERPSDAQMLRGFNALMEKIAGMTDFELAVFEGLTLMESNGGRVKIPVPRLYNLAASTHECHYLSDVSNDEQLGHFFVENDFVPEVENVPGEALDSLDYGKIGREKREEHGGVFLEDGNGYVEWDGDAAEAWKDLDLSPQEPDYTVLLEVRNPEGNTAPLKLPALSGEIHPVLKSLGISDGSGLSIRCLDCRIPALAGLITEQGRIVDANRTAFRLKKMPMEKVTLCKAILTALPCANLDEALTQMDLADQCILTPELTTPAELGRAELAFMLGDHDVDTLLPFVNLTGFGAALLEKDNTILTPYGALDRKDCQPIRGLVASMADDERRDSAETQEQAAKQSQGGRQTRKPGRQAR